MICILVTISLSLSLSHSIYIYVEDGTISIINGPVSKIRFEARKDAPDVSRIVSLFEWEKRSKRPVRRNWSGACAQR